jgi:hypothetical protein
MTNCISFGINLMCWKYRQFWLSSKELTEFTQNRTGYIAGIGGRIVVIWGLPRAKTGDSIRKITKAKKWKSTGLASMRPWAQILVPLKREKKKKRHFSKDMISLLCWLKFLTELSYLLYSTQEEHWVKFTMKQKSKH